WQGHELANGAQELTDPLQARRRMQREQKLRAAAGLAVPPLDERLLAAMHAGLPTCAGVALGVDRLLAIKEGATELAGVLPFDWSRREPMPGASARPSTSGWPTRSSGSHWMAFLPNSSMTVEPRLKRPISSPRCRCSGFFGIICRGAPRWCGGLSGPVQRVSMPPTQKAPTRIMAIGPTAVS